MDLQTRTDMTQFNEYMTTEISGTVKGVVKRFVGKILMKYSISRDELIRLIIEDWDEIRNNANRD